MQNFDAKAAIESDFPRFMKDLARLIAAKSVNAPAIGKAPFGDGIQMALETVLEIAKGFGWRTTIDP